MTDPKRPLTRREARELRRAQEEAAQPQATPRTQTPARSTASSAEPSPRADSATSSPETSFHTPSHRGPARNQTAAPSAPPAAPQPAQAPAEQAPARRRHGRRRSEGPVDGGIPRIPKISPETPEVEAPPVHTPEPSDDETAQRRPVKAQEPAARPKPSASTPPSAPEPRSSDSASQAATPPVPAADETAERPPIQAPEPTPQVPSSASAAPSASEPAVPERAAAKPTAPKPAQPKPVAPEPVQSAPATPTPIKDPVPEISSPEQSSLPPVAPPPPAAKPTEDDDATQLGLPPIVTGGRMSPVSEQGHGDPTSAADPNADVQSALSRHTPNQLDPEKVAELDRERQRNIRDALERHRHQPTEAADSGAGRSFAEVLGLNSRAPQQAGPTKPAEPTPLAPAVAPLNSPQQRQLENTGLVAPVTSTVPVTLSSASSASPAHDGQAVPLHARQAHGLDPLEYRVSGVKRTRAGLAVVIGSVVVAAAAVVLAINL